MSMPSRSSPQIGRISAGTVHGVAPGVSYVWSEANGPSNVGLVVGDDGAVVIDTRMTRELGEAVSDYLSHIDDTGRPRRTVIVNTHFHGDHWFGNAAFPKDTLIVASEVTRKAMSVRLEEQINRFADLRPELKDEFMSFKARPANIGISDSMTVQVDGPVPSGWVRIDTMESGHTDGDVTVWCGDDILFAGDLVFNEAWPVLWDADVHGWIRNLDMLISKEPRVVVPGHGPAGGCDLLIKMREVLELLKHLSGMDAEERGSAIAGSKFAAWSHSERVEGAVKRILATQ